MTRNEQILSEVQKRFSSNDTHLVLKINTFIDGAKWADANPQFSKEKFIEKAIKWLEKYASDYAISTTGDDDDCVVSLDMVEDFRKAMDE
jgi:hypothetical protein